VVIANRDQLGDSSILDELRERGRWTGERGIRTSLTFRHAEKVLKGGMFAKALRR
jgi:alkylated DNA repair protein alkB family protein 6